MTYSVPYKPGEPYEFPDTYWAHVRPGLMRYRCFRASCKGSAVLTVDRDTHNAYHNRQEQS